MVERTDRLTVGCFLQLIRKSIANFTKAATVKNTIEVTSDIQDVPAELYSTIRWIMIRPIDSLETKKRTNVDRASLTMCQNIMYGFKSNRLVNYKPRTESSLFRQHHARENPQVPGLALTIHHKTRDKMLMNLLGSHGFCVPYGCTQRMETALANAVIESTRQLNGLYVPPFLKKGAFVLFVVDNTDFAEDTPDGKGTTHGTITAVYQKADIVGEPVAPPLNITDATLSVTPYHVHMKPCDKPKAQYTKRTKDFVTSKKSSGSNQLSQFGWVVATVVSRIQQQQKASSNIPVWAGYNSLLSESKQLTNIGALPLLPDLAHEDTQMQYESDENSDGGDM
ncbi:LOW QUALITY PROTEIN: uncharacterized protein ACNLHF_005989 [Anomaloglossus baeobatrachus]